MSKQPTVLEIAQWVIAQAKPGEEIEVVASVGTETEIVAYQGEVESLTQASQGGISVRVISEKRTGFAYAGSLDRSDVESTLSSARENSRYTSTDDFAGLAHYDGYDYPELSLFDPETITLPLETKVKLALDLERMVKGLDKRIAEVPHATYGDAFGEMAIVSTNGISVTSSDSYSFAFVQALARQGDETQSGFGYSVGRTPSQVDISIAAQDAADRSTRLLGASKPKSRRIRILFEPRVSATLVSIVGASLSAESVQKGRSIFGNRLGEGVASPLFTLSDNPTDERFQSASPFDGEGLASRTNSLIEDGVLRSYLYDSYTARKDSISSTGSAVRGGYASTPSPGPRALSLSKGIREHSEIVASCDQALLVQSISGVHSGVNPISGDFSVGAEGVMIRGGELAEGVKESTISSTIQRMLLGVSEVANNETFFPGISSGVTISIEEMSLSGS